MQRVLFICSRNRLRSPTAEQVFAAVPGVETDSAGLAPDADCPLSPEQIEWADLICVMEKRHRAQLARRFKRYLSGKKVVCLDIQDDYQFMQPELVSLLQKRVQPHLR
ncbi:MAG: low molecular weight protein tyrosine phosphatase family protein [Comamonas sp.]|nr:low molecular weight protein tyrosine phosphatase family protein [Comamonas sp.]